MADVAISTYTNQSTGVREMSATIFDDVENVIQNISPDKTPFISMIGKKKATNTLHEWLEDELKTPTGSNAALEGADAVAATRTPPKRLNSYTQIMEDTFMVSGTMDAVKTIGRAEESKYQLEKSLKYLATELEYAMLNNSASVAGDGSTARKTKGLAGWITTNDMSYSSYAATNDFDEAKFMAMGQACFKAGGDPSVLLVPPDQARKIAGWDGNSRITVNTNASEKTLVMAVMVLETPFGRVKVTIDLWIAQDTSTDKYDRVFLIDPSKFAVAWLRNIQTTELAKTGDSRKYQTIGEAAFVCYSEKASAKAYKCACD